MRFVYIPSYVRRRNDNSLETKPPSSIRSHCKSETVLEQI